MPHVVLEYSNNVKEQESFESLFVQLHQILITVCSASVESCKSRAIPHAIFYIGDGNRANAFIHLEIRLADGRSLQLREEAGRQMLAILEQHFSQSLAELNLQITVEVREFPRNLYFKIPAETI